MQHKLTIQQLANLCNYAWEVERNFGFYMRPDTFKTYVVETPESELRCVLESLSELFRTVREIGLSEVELKAAVHPFTAKLNSIKTPTAAACGADENILLTEEND